ncbi:MAG TPA: AraC family transcriptional regulator [Polyangiaceae bacterium]
MKTETQSFYQAAVERTVRRVAASLDTALDLAALARAAALSPFHFHRIFRGMVGETPLELHRRLRLERAAYRLLGSDASVTTLAFDAGYETHEAFTRAFRQAYGAPPSSFRETVRGPRAFWKVHLAARSGVHFDPTVQEPHTHFEPQESTMNVTVETVPELRIAAVHHVGPYNRISDAFQRLDALVRPAGLLREGTQMLAIYHDDPETTPAAELQADAGITVPEGLPLPEGLVEKRIPAGRYARTTHAGPYATLGDTWARFMGQWLPGSQERVGPGSSYEVYRNTPMNAAPAELRTDLYLPVT